MLAAVRERALANKSGEELSASLGLYLPDPDTIRRVGVFLRSIEG